MIIHYKHDKPTNVYVVNSRLPVYRSYYGDSFANTIAGLFTRMAPRVAPIAKQLSMKAIDVIRDRGIIAVENLATKASSAAKDKIMSLVQRQKKQPVVLLSTTVLPASVSKAINSVAEQNQALLAASPVTPLPSTDATNSAIMNAIAGSGLKLKQNTKNFQRR